jgi:hypothetical protein
VLAFPDEAAARAAGQPKSVEDTRPAQQAEEDPYVESLRNESFDQGLRRVHMTPALDGEIRGLLIILPPNNPCIVEETLSKSRRFSKLLAHVRDSKPSGDVKQVVDVLHENAQWYLAARAEVEEKILKMMADQPELFRAGVELSERQQGQLTDLFHGFGTTERVGLDGAGQGLAAISFLLGETEDISAVGPLLEIADRDDGPFFEEIDKPGTRRMYPCPTANREVIADALDRILVAEAGRAAADSPTGKIASEYLQWRQEVGLPERKTVSVYPYDRPRAEAKTMPLSLPMMEPMRLARPLSEEMAKKVDMIIEYARRLPI